MGDGQHGWAAAEWVMMIRNMFVREEGDRLIVGSGLFAEWFETDDDIYFRPDADAVGTGDRAHRRSRDGAGCCRSTPMARGTRRESMCEFPGFAQLVDVDCSSAIHCGLRTRVEATSSRVASRLARIASR